jgi:hypothetical protein
MSSQPHAVPYIRKFKLHGKILRNYNPSMTGHINTACQQQLAKDKHHMVALQTQESSVQLDQHFDKGYELGPCDLRTLRDLFAANPPIRDLTINSSSFRHLKVEEAERLLEVLWEKTSPTLTRLELAGATLNIGKILVRPPYRLPRLKEFVLHASGYKSSKSATMTGKDIDNLELLFTSFSPTVENLCIFGYRKVAFALEPVLPYLKMPRLLAVEIDSAEGSTSWGLHYFLRHTSPRLSSLKIQMRPMVDAENDFFMSGIGATDGKHTATILPPQTLGSLTLQKLRASTSKPIEYAQWITSECKETLQELHLAGRPSFEQITYITRSFSPCSNILHYLDLEMDAVSIRLFEMLSEVFPCLERLKILVAKNYSSLPGEVRIDSVLTHFYRLTVKPGMENSVGPTSRAGDSPMETKDPAPTFEGRSYFPR